MFQLSIKKLWDSFPTSAIRQIINSMSIVRSYVLWGRLWSEIDFPLLFFYSSKVLEKKNNTFWQIQSISNSNPWKSPIIMQESWKFLLEPIMRNARRWHRRQKKTKKTPSNNCSANNTNNAPITNRYTCKCYTRNLSPFLFADAWYRTCLEVANFLRGQRAIYQ